MPKEEIPFIHLRVHSSYSLSEGAITPKDMAGLCVKHNMPAVAMTDSGNMFGTLEFSKAASSEGVQPIIGCVLQVDFSENNSKGVFHKPVYDKILLIAKNKTGYQNLLKLAGKSFLEPETGEESHIKCADLYKYNEGIIVLTGNTEGIIGRLLLGGQEKEAEKFLLELKEYFGDRLYIELMRHGLPEQEKIEQAQIDLALKHNVALVATNNVYFATENMHEAHDALLCIAQGRYVSEEDRCKVSKECYFKSARQMQELFSDIPEALINTAVIAKRCSVKSEEHKPMLPHFPCESGASEAEELRIMAGRGLQLRLESKVFKKEMTEEEKQEIAKPYIERLEYELGVIIQMDFPGYFLIVSDFMRWGKRQGIPLGPGRGSGAGSMVAWALEITDLDPLRFGLLFERFLNPERVSMPDFDIDFCQERREEVIKYVQGKYGRDKVAQIITFGKLQAKAVLRDVGRVLQMSYNQVDKISKMIPFNPIDPVTLQKALDMDKALRQMRDEDREIRHLIDIGLKLEGLNRHASTHAAGVVIADRPLDELVPVYRDPKSDMPVSGYSMKYTEAAGLVKFDFLGLKTLTVIAKACDFIRQRGIEIDIADIPLDDKKTFTMLSKGDSVGVFQIESAGMRDTLRKLKPDNIEDIIALISLYRPGPMDNIPAYIARKHKLEDPDYLDPMLTEVLKETYGVIIYQEQVMQIAQVMGGYSLGAADLLRRAMGKKIASEMDQQRKIFVDGALKNKVDKDKASAIFDLVAKFAGYGFNKSHAAAYAMISYQTGYLKANYPVEFLAASMNLEINDTDKINSFARETIEQGIEILLPDVNKSGAYFKPEQKADGTYGIRYGLGALKNVGAAAMQAMEEERSKNGKFTDIFDFVSRLGSKYVNKRLLENLIRSGAFDLLHNNRKQLFESIETLIRYGAMVTLEKNSSQSSLFGGDDMVQDKPALPAIADWKGTERLGHEFGAIGLYLTDHPINIYSSTLERMNIVKSGEFDERLGDGNSSVRMAGVVVSKRMRSSPRGKFATVVMSDPDGLFEISIYDEDLLAEARDLLDPGVILLISANARKDEGGVRITADGLTLLEEAVSNQKLNLQIDISHIKALEKLKENLGSKGKGRTRIALTIKADNYHVEIDLPDHYPVSIAAIEELKEIDGVGDIREVG